MGSEQHRRSTESYGIGQSGYTAGRREHDLALEQTVHVQYQAYPKGADDRPPQGGDDDRFTGRGGPPWQPGMPY